MTIIRLRTPGLYFSKIKEIASFVAKPRNQISNNLSTKDKMKEIVALYLICLLIVAFLIVLLKSIFHFDDTFSRDFIEKYDPLTVLFLGAILTPLFEEATFRLSIKFKPTYLSTSIGLLTLITCSEILEVGPLGLG